MDASFYKSLTNFRGLRYHYYYVPPETTGRDVLLLLHGFPGCSYDWRRQIEFFQKRGYGILAPDLLGFGKSDRPIEPHLYKSSLICQDVLNLLDAEKVETAVVMGHDWGAKICSRLANYFPQRCRAFVFVAVGYLPPEFPPPASQIEAFREQTKAVAGYEFFGYWYLFCSEEGRALLEKRKDSFMSMCFTDNPLLAISDFCPPGALQSWLEKDKRSPVFLSPEELAMHAENFYRGDIRGPLAWYKVLVESIDAEDNKGIPSENVKIDKPVFYAGCLRDHICIAALQRASLFKYCTNWVFEDYLAGHWVIIEDPDKLNADLLAWMEGFSGSSTVVKPQKVSQEGYLASLYKSVRLSSPFQCSE